MVPENSLLIRNQKHSRPQKASKCTLLVDKPSTPEIEGQKEDCPLFDKLPLEIRHLVYELLLVSVVPIGGSRALKNICRKHKTIVRHRYKSFAGIDTRFLLTCRQAYKEAVGVLYGNDLQFSNAQELRDFRTERLLSEESVLEGTIFHPTLFLGGGFHLEG